MDGGKKKREKVSLSLSSLRVKRAEEGHLLNCSGQAMWRERTVEQTSRQSCFVELTRNRRGPGGGGSVFFEGRKAKASTLESCAIQF